MDAYIQPQTFLTIDAKGKLPHLIARLEHLDQDWNTFSALMRGKNVDLGGTLPKLNKSLDPSESRGISRSLSPIVQRNYELTYGSDIKLSMQPQTET